MEVHSESLAEVSASPTACINKKDSKCCRQFPSSGTEVSSADPIQPTGKAAASLRPGSEMLLGNSLGW